MKNNQEIIDKLKEMVNEFPKKPGIYIMRDNENKVIYVGKAKNLFNRVKSYFNRGKDIKTTVLMRTVYTIEYTVTDTEYEALLLENNLIKKWTPKFNIDLKDGKSYAVIAITKEEFPRVYKTRNTSSKGAWYYGPFPDTSDITRYLELIKKIYPLRTCKGRPLKMRDKPCLMYHIKKCDGPCIGVESQEEYSSKIESIKKILSGQIGEITSKLSVEMEEYSEKLEFEKAGETRDIIQSLEKLRNKQKIVDFSSDIKDYLGYYTSGDKYLFVIMKMREGYMVDKTHYFSTFIGSDFEAIEQFVVQYYSNSRIPEYLYLPIKGDICNFESFFSDKGSKKTYIKIPERGKNLSIINMANENARMEFEKRIKRDGDYDGLYALKEALSLDCLPQRIEGFDIAQLDGHFTVSSLVSFYNGVPDKKNYKRFKMKSLGGQIDDFKSISEAVARRYTRVLNDNLERPDLILIDGGKGQVSAAYSVLETLGLDIPLAGLAKKHEHIFRPGESDPIILPEGSPGLRILQSVRDETHRFATDYNKLLRKKKLKLSSLESVPGIGPIRAKKILTTFGGIDKIKESTPLEISKKGSINIELAETLYEYLNKKG